MSHRQGFLLTRRLNLSLNGWTGSHSLLPECEKRASFYLFYLFFPIKDKLTTCFLLLLGLKFQKLGRFQKRFDAHFCPLENTFFGEKAVKQTRLCVQPATGRGSRSEAEGGVGGRKEKKRG